MLAEGFVFAIFEKPIGEIKNIKKIIRISPAPLKSLKLSSINIFVKS